ncbi:MAG: CYTH domain-containing protein [Chloroflexota bacterium]
MPAVPHLTDTEEIEYKLAAVGPDPRATLDRIAALEMLGGYAIGPVMPHQIHDIYFDTPERGLGDLRLSLRLRTQDGHTRFTAKGSLGSQNGLFRRQELELPAAWDNWCQVRDALNGAGAALTVANDQHGGPRDWIVRAGLQVTQDRETHRRARNVLVGDVPAAELAIDATTYHLGPRTVEYREIEIEQLPGSAIDARALGELLQLLFPGELEPATMGKYSRGLKLSAQEQAAGESR